jgi:hypothetical protein
MQTRDKVQASLSAVALAVALLSTSVAHASTVFPGEVQSHLGLKTTPACTLCHQTLAGGTGTATKPFGASIRAHGGVAGSTASIDSALDAMSKDGTDSDGDCVGDIAELVAGTDPDNGADNPGACGDGGSSGGSSSSGAPAAPLSPEYGCAAAAPPSCAGGPGPFAFLAVLGAWALLRRRARPVRAS